MFQFPASAPTKSRRRVFNPPGSPIRTSPDQFLFADPRSFSQLTTSFFASGSQGILRSLLFSFSYFIQVNTLRHLRLNSYSFAFEIAVPYYATRKNSNLVIQTIISFNFFYLVISLSIVNDLKMCIHSCYSLYKIKTDCKYKEVRKDLPCGTNRELRVSRLTPKRRCSSHTFRYGYLVTT